MIRSLLSSRKTSAFVGSTWIVSGANTFSGGTTINARSLRAMNKTVPHQLLRSLSSLLFTVFLGTGLARAEVQSKGAFGEASMAFDGKILKVSTGRVEREWKLTNQGFATVDVKDLLTQKVFGDQPVGTCDWSLPGMVPESAPAKLKSLTAHESDDEGFTTRHLEIAATFDYPAQKVSVRYVIWAYPGQAGLRTQLWIKAPPATAGITGDGRVDFVPVDAGKYQRRYFGYYSGTQDRNSWDKEMEILREEVKSGPLSGPETVDWASGACVERAGEGLMLVKESQKCVLTPGVNTGVFMADPHGFSNTGLRISFSKKDHGKPKADEGKSEPQSFGEFRWAWASWCLVYDGSADGRELSIKDFYATRFPLNLKRDVYAQANTWGSGNGGKDSRDRAKEDAVLKEIDSVADLGLDSLQIDDGWQQRGKGAPWRPSPEAYPQGWGNVVKHAKEKGVTLSLWAASMQIPLEDMKWNFEQAGFRSWKLDFAKLTSADAIDTNLEKIRSFGIFTHHQAQTAWDVTEKSPRYGYYWAREFGCCWLANRKQEKPESTVYKPGPMLRDVWLLAKYVNLNKIQIPVQNIDKVDKKTSDAYRYNHPYSVAIALAGIPCFFQTTNEYSPEARDQIRPLVALWKEHREEMFSSLVFPIGELPTPTGWCGFQFYKPGRTTGYLLIFREIDSKDSTQSLALRFLAGKTIELEDLRTGAKRKVNVPEDGKVPFEIQKPADFLFIKYSL